MADTPADTEPTVEEVVSWAHYASRKWLASKPGSWHYADDVLSDALITAWQAQDRYDPSRGMTRRNYTLLRCAGGIVDGMRARGHYGRQDVKDGALTDDELVPAPRRRPISLQEVEEKTGAELNLGCEDRAYRTTEQRMLVLKLLDLLNEREREVLAELYLADRQQRAYARSQGLTEGAICQVQRRALGKLRAHLEARGVGLPELLAA